MRFIPWQRIRATWKTPTAFIVFHMSCQVGSNIKTACDLEARVCNYIAYCRLLPPFYYRLHLNSNLPVLILFMQPPSMSPYWFFHSPLSFYHIVFRNPSLAIHHLLNPVSTNEHVCSSDCLINHLINQVRCAFIAEEDVWKQVGNMWWQIIMRTIRCQSPTLHRTAENRTADRESCVKANETTQG